MVHSKPPLAMSEVEPGRRLHGGLIGTPGAPSVIYDAGAFGLYADGWHVAQALRGDHNVLLFDRAGLGRSDAPPANIRPTPAFHVADMRRLAHALALPPPFLLIGHSMAGLRLHAFANLHLNEVAGLIFVDAVRPRALNGERGRRLARTFARFLTGGVWAARLGLPTVVAPFLADPLDLPKPHAAEKRRAAARLSHYKGARAEVEALVHDKELDFGAERAVERPVAVFARTRSAFGNAELADAATARGGFGRVTILPEESHVSLLNARNAARIAEAARAMRLANGKTA